MRNWKAVKRHNNIYFYQTAKGKRYGVRRGFTSDDGKRHEFSKSGFRTTSDAEAILVDFENKLYRKQITPFLNDSTTFQQLFNNYFDYCKNTKKLKGATLTNKHVLYNHHLTIFDNFKIDKITPSQYQELINKFEDSPMKLSTIKAVNTLFNAIINYAVNNGLLTRNKFKNVVISKTQNKFSKTIQNDDFKKWINIARTQLDDTYLLLIELLCMGMRKSEALGLRFCDLKNDESKETLLISIVNGRNYSQPNGGSLKNQFSKRQLIIKGNAYFRLVKLYNAQKMKADANGININDDTYLLLDKKGNPVPCSSPTSVCQKINAETALNVTPHKLRHFFATKAKNTGVADTTIAKWLGHSNVNTTNNYVRTTTADLTNLINGINKIVP